MLNKKNQSLELIYIKEIKSGKELLETRRFRNLKVDALEEAIIEVADAIAALSVGNFKEYQVTTQATLTK